MSLSIGLEALNRNQGTTKISFEAAYSDAMEAGLALQDEIQHGIDLMNLLDNVGAIRKSVKRFGFSKSVESLIGHKLGSTRVSVEEEATKVQRTTWEKIVDWFKKIWRHISDWFAKMFKTRRGVMLRLKEIKDGSKTFKVKDTAKTFTGYTAASLRTISTVNIDGIKTADDANAKVKDLPSTEEVKLVDSDIKDYAGILLAVLQAMDGFERGMNSMYKTALNMTQRGVNKPDEDIDAAREMQKAFGSVSKIVTKYINGAFKSARAFLNYIKKS